VYPDSRHRAACLTPGALALGATVQRLLQQALPEPLSPLGVVRRKLDERQLRTGHLSNLLSMLESTKELERKTAYRELRKTVPTLAVVLLRPVNARKTAWQRDPLGSRDAAVADLSSVFSALP
jgi:hypothetical protein